jgi:hypothetical protein
MRQRGLSLGQKSHACSAQYYHIARPAAWSATCVTTSSPLLGYPMHALRNLMRACLSYALVAPPEETRVHMAVQWAWYKTCCVPPPPQTLQKRDTRHMHPICHPKRDSWQPQASLLSGTQAPLFKVVIASTTAPWTLTAPAHALPQPNHQHPGASNSDRRNARETPRKVQTASTGRKPGCATLKT